MHSLWERLLERLESEYDEQDILTWLKPLQVSAGDGRLRLLAPNAFVLDVVRERFPCAHRGGGRSISPALKSKSG
jgi:chromosomal replication initiator protein